MVGPVIVAVLRVHGQDPPKVLSAVDQQMVEALAPQRPPVLPRKRVRPG
jgi:hypothetical protein